MKEIVIEGSASVSFTADSGIAGPLGVVAPLMPEPAVAAPAAVRGTVAALTILPL